MYEIEKKFLVKNTPKDLSLYKCRKICQAYLCTTPVIRIRQDNNKYELTYKGSGLEIHEEVNIPIKKEAFTSLLTSSTGNIINKTRYEIPYLNYIIELDIFHDKLEGLILAEVEFPSLEASKSFIPPTWFDRDVTLDKNYYNSNLRRKNEYKSI